MKSGVKPNGADFFHSEFTVNSQWSVKCEISHLEPWPEGVGIDGVGNAHTRAPIEPCVDARIAPAATRADVADV